MSSYFVFGPLTQWVSNGIAQELDHGWRRHLEGPLDEPVWHLADFLYAQAEYTGGGCQGFDLAWAPLDTADQRRRFGRAMVSLLRESWRVVATRDTDGPLAWLGGHEPFYQASFLSEQVLLCAAYRGSSDGEGLDLPPLDLPLPQEQRVAFEECVRRCDEVGVRDLIEEEILRGLAPWTHPVTLRPARDKDVPELIRIERDADARFAAAGHLELATGDGIPVDVALRAIAQGRITVAEVAGALAGWAYVGRVDGEPCLGQISVAVAYGRRGVGDALLRAVIDRARDEGAASLVLNTQADVPWNAPWYARRGFVVVPREGWGEGLRAIERDQTAQGLDWSTRVHMRLALRT